MRFPLSHVLCIVCEDQLTHTFLDISAHLPCGHTLHIKCLVECFLEDINQAVCPNCFTEVNNILLRNFIHAFLHTLESPDIINDIGILNYEIVFPFENNLIKREYIPYLHIPTPMDQDLIRRSRYTEMINYITKIIKIHSEYKHIIKFPARGDIKDIPLVELRQKGL